MAIEPPPDPVTSVSCPSIHWSPWSCMQKLWNICEYMRKYFIIFLMEISQECQISPKSHYSSWSSYAYPSSLPSLQRSTKFMFIHKFDTNLVLPNMIYLNIKTCSNLLCSDLPNKPRSDDCAQISRLRDKLQIWGQITCPCKRNTLHADCQHWILVLS